MLEHKKHDGVLSGNDSGLVARVVCADGGDVQVSQVRGSWIIEVGGEAFDPAGGPLFLDCEQHGQYLGLIQLLKTGRTTETGDEVSLDLVLIPLRDIEHILPLRTAQQLGQNVPGSTS